MAWDQMLAADNKQGEALIMGDVNGLVTQTQSVQRAVEALGPQVVAFEGTDSFGNPNAVFQSLPFHKS